MTPEELTPAFFSDVLGAPVERVEATRIGEGLVGMNMRIALTYADHDAARPASVVVKLPSIDETSRQSGIALRNYERECRFYAELAPTLAGRFATCHHVAFDETTHDFVLVLDDLAPAQPGDQITGCEVDEAAAAVRELVGIHAPRWGDPALDSVEWLSRRRGGDEERIQAMYDACWPMYVERYGHRLSADQHELGDRFRTHVGRWLAGRTPPFTVVHGDYRLDNLLFGSVDGEAAVWAVDWQTPAHSTGVSDLAYFLGAGLRAAHRGVHERELVDLYRDAMRADGVEIDADELWSTYRREAFAGVVMAVIASAVVGRTDRGDEMFVAMGTRHLQHALELDALALV